MNRKTLFCFLTALIMIFVLAGCSGKNSGGNIDNVQIPDWKPSEIYSDSDIEAAFQTVKDYFGNEFDGCTLTKLTIPEIHTPMNFMNGLNNMTRMKQS